MTENDRPLSGMDREEKGRICLAVLRIVLGFMLVWAFFDKLLGLGMLTTPEMAVINGGSPTEYYLSELVSGVFAGMFHAIAGNAVVDFLLMAGLILVGLGLMLGIASKLSTVGLCIMMALMYMMSVPPSDNPIVDYHIVYILAVVTVYWLGGFETISLNRWYCRIGIVNRWRILQ